MARIPDNEIERLGMGFGVELKRHGGAIQMAWCEEWKDNQ